MLVPAGVAPKAAVLVNFGTKVKIWHNKNKWQTLRPEAENFVTFTLLKIVEFLCLNCKANKPFLH